MIVGTTSGPQAETLTNTGGSELAISGMTITGTNALDFDQNSTCGSSLGAGASCTLNVTFTPNQLGPLSASITINDDAMVSSQVLPLAGVGGDSGPNVTLSPTSLAFDSQDTDTTSAAQTITLSNYGTMTLSITGITASTNFGETNNCNSTLASGASCTVTVTFTPSQTGSLNGTLSVADSAADSPQIVSLSGTGVWASAAGRDKHAVRVALGWFARSEAVIDPVIFASPRDRETSPGQARSGSGEREQDRVASTGWRFYVVTKQHLLQLQP